MMTPQALVAVAIICIATLTNAQEMKTPAPGISARQVVEIQLQALQQNNSPTRDSGILQTWIFAHPRNKRQTGPLERFRQMIKSPNYRTMLDHRHHSVETVVESATRALYSVVIVTASGQKRAFQWEVQKVTQGAQAGAWMTTSVSPPLRPEDST